MSMTKIFGEFTWFEKKQIRDEAHLSDEDLRWLRGWSVAPFGIAGIFYLLARKLVDIFTAIILGRVLSDSYDFLKPLFYIGPHQYRFGPFVALIFSLLFFSLIMLSLYYGPYFIARHGKRLSWNRGNWNSVEELKASEKKWFTWNFLPSVVVITSIFIFLRV